MRLLLPTREGAPTCRPSGTRATKKRMTTQMTTPVKKRTSPTSVILMQPRDPVGSPIWPPHPSLHEKRRHRHQLRKRPALKKPAKPTATTPSPASEVDHGPFGDPFNAIWTHLRNVDYTEQESPQEQEIFVT